MNSKFQSKEWESFEQDAKQLHGLEEMLQLEGEEWMQTWIPYAKAAHDFSVSHLGSEDAYHLRIPFQLAESLERDGQKMYAAWNKLEYVSVDQHSGTLSIDDKYLSSHTEEIIGVLNACREIVGTYDSRLLNHLPPGLFRNILKFLESLSEQANNMGSVQVVPSGSICNIIDSTIERLNSVKDQNNNALFSAEERQNIYETLGEAVGGDYHRDNILKGLSIITRCPYSGYNSDNICDFISVIAENIDGKKVESIAEGVAAILRAASTYKKNLPNVDHVLDAISHVGENADRDDTPSHIGHQVAQMLFGK